MFSDTARTDAFLARLSDWLKRDIRTVQNTKSKEVVAVADVAKVVSGQILSTVSKMRPLIGEVLSDVQQVAGNDEVIADMIRNSVKSANSLFAQASGRLSNRKDAQDQLLQKAFDFLRERNAIEFVTQKYAKWLVATRADLLKEIIKASSQMLPQDKEMTPIDFCSAVIGRIVNPKWWRDEIIEAMLHTQFPDIIKEL